MDQIIAKDKSTNFDELRFLQPFDVESSIVTVWTPLGVVHI